jgi:PAS domain-containing protein
MRYRYIPPASLAEADARLQAVANTSADGMLIVDADGHVRYVNPAAERLLRRRAADLIGKIFGLPMITGEAVEISLIQADGNLLAAEMRTVANTWEGLPAQLIMLRDLSEQHRTKEALRDAEGFSRSILNSLIHHIAVLDEAGTIVLANDAWRQFAIENGDPLFTATGVGANYFAVCATSSGDNSQEAPAVLRGMRSVIQGELPVFELEYPCHSPTEERWFQLRVVPLHGQRRGLVISHTNVTDQRRSAEAVAEAAVLRERLLARERELMAVGALSSPEHSSSSSSIQMQRGDAPLRTARPASFQECVGRYAELLEEVVNERGFAIKNTEAPARALAAGLGGLGATARDVVEIHLAALRSRSIGAAPSRQQAYLEEGRVFLLQLMGYLVAYYRDTPPA